MQRSKLALVAGILGALGVFDMALGPALIQLGAISPMMGFQWFFLLGALEAIAGLLLGLGGLYTTRVEAKRSGRGLALLGVCGGLAAFAAIAIGGSSGRGLPPINDISTDLADPPAFASDPSGRGRDMAYPADFAAQVKATPAYEDLQPIRVPRPPERVLADAELTARALGWEVAEPDAAAGTLLASEATKLFRFVDDVVVRVRDDGTGGSVVDVRSKSRDGRGDVGANAARIRKFYAALPR